MSARYAIRDGLAWIEALDGGRHERIAWMADIQTGEHFSVEDTGWLVWILLDEGAETVEELNESAESEGATAALREVDLPAFLEDLVQRGLLVRRNESD